MLDADAWSCRALGKSHADLLDAAHRLPTHHHSSSQSSTCRTPNRCIAEEHPSAWLCATSCACRARGISSTCARTVNRAMRRAGAPVIYTSRRSATPVNTASESPSGVYCPDDALEMGGLIDVNCRGPLRNTKCPLQHCTFMA
jgi:hypothetical protein